MFEINTVLFLALVGFGAAVQTVTGFAMGLMIMAGVALLGVADISFAAAVVSFISLVNVGIALRKGYREIEWRYVGWVLVSLVPAMAVGIVLLTYLSLHYYQVLKMLLGGVVILAGTMLMISPSPWETQSKKASIIFFGSLGGILAGLYSAGGAPLAYFLYRQPLSINVIRFSLLAIFGASTAIRSVMIGVSGQLTLEILKMSLLAIPIVVLITLGTSKIVPYIPDRAVRMAVFVVLIAAGAMLLAGDYIDLSIHKVSQN